MTVVTPIHAFNIVYNIAPLFNPKIFKVNVGMTTVMIPSQIIEKTAAMKYNHLYFTTNGSTKITPDYKISTMIFAILNENLSIKFGQINLNKPFNSSPKAPAIERNKSSLSVTIPYVLNDITIKTPKNNCGKQIKYKFQKCHENINLHNGKYLSPSC